MNKLAGRLPLQDMITSIIDSARVKVAAAEDTTEGKKEKLLAYEKKEHGGKIPSVKEEKEEKKESKEKMSSAIDFFNPEELEKFASALDMVGDQLMSEKEADAKETGSESHQGGQVLPTAVPPKGTQAYKKDSSQGHNIPMTTGKQADPSQGKAATQVENNHAKAPGGPAYPSKGVLKVGGIDAVLAKLAEDKEESKGSSLPPFMAKKKDEPKKEEKKEEKEERGEEKKSSALDYVLGKMAESSQGGMTLDSKSGEGPKPPSDSAGGNGPRSALESNQAAINMKKIDGKKPQKKMLSEVLTEPAYSKAHDSKVHENLQNPSKGGVKIAADEAKSLLRKVANEGCKCEGKGSCMYCKMKAAADGKKKEKESMSAGGSGMGLSAPTPVSTPPGMSGSI